MPKPTSDIITGNWGPTPLYSTLSTAGTPILSDQAVPFIQTNLVAQYKLLQGANDQTIYDEKATYNGYRGSTSDIVGDTNDPIWNTYGLDFDWTDDYITTPIVFNPATDSFTVMLVCRPTDSVTSQQVIVQQLDGSGTAGRSWLSINTSGLFNTFLGGTTNSVGGAAVLNTDYVITLRHSPNNISLIKNNFESTKVSTITSEAETIGTVRIGCNKAGGNAFGGYIGPVLFYNSFISDADLTHNYGVYKNLGRGITLL